MHIELYPLWENKRRAIRVKVLIEAIFPEGTETIRGRRPLEVAVWVQNCWYKLVRHQG